MGWRIELYGIREGWFVMWDGNPRSVSHEEICLEEQECDAVYTKRTFALSNVSHALTKRACPRRC